MNQSTRNPVDPGVNPDPEVAVFAKGTGINFLGKTLGRGIHLFTQVLLARLLGTAGYGLYAIGWNIMRAVDLFAPLGLDKGVIQMGVLHWNKDPVKFKTVIRSSITISLLTGSFFGMVFFLSAPWIANLFGKPSLLPVFRLFAIAFPVASGLRVAASTTRITKQMRFSIISEELGQPLTNLILLLAFYLLGWGIAGSVGAAVASFIFGFSIALYYVWKLFFRDTSDR
ncbi:MAG: oligosaccharide flippase family protein, partial [Chloroflexota bacterium]